MGLLAKVGVNLVDKFLTGGAGGTIAKMAGSLIGLIPDKNARREAEEKLDLVALEQQWKLIATEADLEKTLREALKEENLGQMKINLEDAKSSRWYQNGWRPACGWVGAFSLLYATFGDSVFGWVSFWQGLVDVPPPPANTQFIQLVLLGMLGLRGTEKYFQARVPK